MHEFLKTVKEGQILVASNGEQFIAKHPYVSESDGQPLFTVHDEKGTCYIGRDIDIKKSIALASQQNNI